MAVPTKKGRWGCPSAYDDSSLEVALDSSLVVAIFNTLSEETGLSGEELDGLAGKGSIELNYHKKVGSFTLRVPLPLNH